MAMRRRSLKSVSIFPVPSTTEANGSSAIETGRPVSSRMRRSRFFSSAPPREHNAAITDIGADFRRRALECNTDRIENSCDAIGESFANLPILHRNRFGHSLDEIAAFDLHGEGPV